MRALLCLFVACAFAIREDVYQDAFISWMTKYEKSYAPEEFFYKYGVFKTNYDFVLAHNTANHSWEVELNKFADLTSAEFKIMYNGYKPELRRNQRVEVKTLADLRIGLILLALLIGFQKVLLLASRIKVNADLVGHSVPLVRLKVLFS